MLLSTASILVEDSNGHVQTVRALLYSAIQSSFITETCINTLGLTRIKSTVKIQALAGTLVPKIRGIAKILMRPMAQGSLSLTIDVLILPRITGLIPSKKVWKADSPYITSIKLGDSNYHEPQTIDVLLGADVFSVDHLW